MQCNLYHKSLIGVLPQDDAVEPRGEPCYSAVQ